MYAAIIRPGRRGRRGLTLIEVMVALFIFALLTILFASSLVVGKSAATINGQYAQAISLAQHKIDQLRAVGYGRLTYTELDDAGIIDATPTTAPYSFAVVDNVVSSDAATPLIGATATLNITDYDARVKLITVTIKWRSNAKRSALSSQVTQYAQIATD